MELKITNETKNPLFPRTEVRAEVEKETVPAKEEVLEALATKYKVDKEAIKIMTIKGKFGLKVFEVNAHIYSSAEEKNRIEVKTKQEKEAEKKGAPKMAFTFPDDFIQFDTRTMGRGIITKRYKFSRWFAPGDHHKPETWQALTGRNDLELYDLESDPLELHNLAFNPETERELIMTLNVRLNNLIEREVGVDLGGHMPGDANIWTSEK